MVRRQQEDSRPWGGDGKPHDVQGLGPRMLLLRHTMRKQLA